MGHLHNIPAMEQGGAGDKESELWVRERGAAPQGERAWLTMN